MERWNIPVDLSYFTFNIIGYACVRLVNDTLQTGGNAWCGKASMYRKVVILHHFRTQNQFKMITMLMMLNDFKWHNIPVSFKSNRKTEVKDTPTRVDLCRSDHKTIKWNKSLRVTFNRMCSTHGIVQIEHTVHCQIQDCWCLSTYGFWCWCCILPNGIIRWKPQTVIVEFW